jgi:PAS domain-containing protein
LYDTKTGVSEALRPGRSLARAATVTVGGRTWTLYFTALPDYQASVVNSYEPIFVLGGGTILSVLLAWLIYSYARSRERAIVLAQKITGELEGTKKDLQNFLDGLSTFAAKVDTTGKVIFANKIAMGASGLGEKFVGSEFLSGSWFMYNQETATRVKEAFKKALAGVPAKYDEQVELNMPQGKTLVAIDFSLTPVMHEGSVLYIIAEGRDISIDKKIEEEIRQKSSDLERMNKLMVDRELKMAEMKKKLHESGMSV